MVICRKDTSGTRVALRDFPYPYNAMAALINDCDNTTPRSFERYHRFLNTREQTIYGTGLGLDVSDSFFAYTASADRDLLMTYFLGADPDIYKEARRIGRYIRCGWIDAIHSYGDFSTGGAYETQSGGAKSGSGETDGGGAELSGGETDFGGAQFGGNPQSGGDETAGKTLFSRDLATKASAALRADGVFPLVWTDHGNEGNAQNFGSYGPRASERYKYGDAPSSEKFYHTDVTLPGGIKYVWDAERSARFGYGFPLRARTLRDGSKVWSFARYTGGSENSVENIDGVNAGGIWDWYPDRLRYVLTERRLSGLSENRQYGLFAQHLGFYGEDYVMEAEDIAALRLLADYQHERGEILVAGAARLFEYATAQKFVSYTAEKVAADTPGGSANNIIININSIDDPLFPDPAPGLDRLRGLTFYCDGADTARIFICGKPVPESELTRNAPDYTGRPSVSIRWHSFGAGEDYTKFG